MDTKSANGVLPLTPLSAARDLFVTNNAFSILGINDLLDGFTLSFALFNANVKDVFASLNTPTIFNPLNSFIFSIGSYNDGLYSFNNNGILSTLSTTYPIPESNS